MFTGAWRVETGSVGGLVVWETGPAGRKLCRVLKVMGYTTMKDRLAWAKHCLLIPSGRSYPDTVD